MPNPQPQSCDLIIKDGGLLTMDARRTIVPRGAIAIQGHTIAAAGLQAEILRDWRATDVIDARGAIVHPGCVDAHLHVNAQTCRGFFRGDASKGAVGGPNYPDCQPTLTPAHD